MRQKIQAALHISGCLLVITADASRGLSVQFACVGNKHHALIAYGEFTSNFLQGFIITRSPQTGQLQRLDFAERSPPQWIYIGQHETLAVMPTHGRGEYGNKKYIVYRRANREGAEADIRGSNLLPPSKKVTKWCNCQLERANEIHHRYADQCVVAASQAQAGVRRSAYFIFVLGFQFG